jgi:flagellar hook-associated protein 2
MFTTGIHGVYATLDRLSRTTTSTGDPGTLGGSIRRYSELKKSLAGEKVELAEAQDKLRANLVRRFAGTDSRVGGLRATLSFLKNQVDAWNTQRS